MLPLKTPPPTPTQIAPTAPTRVTIPLERVDESFRALGSTVRLAIAAPGARMLYARARAEIDEFEACASRFRPTSELCALNADPRRVVPASPRLRAAVAAALWAANETGGLVDPCLLDELEDAGYDRSFDTWGAADDIGAAAPLDEPAPARPRAAARWRRIRIDDRGGTIERPPGLRLDLGGSGKGHVADRLADIVGSAREWLVDAGGDLRVGGGREVRVAHPLREEPAAVLQLEDGAVATSSIVRRCWRTAGGAAHHLLDPATGRPAWTGLISVTALAPTTLHAETLAKAALLSGAQGARRILARHGGLIIHDDGEVEAA